MQLEGILLLFLLQSFKITFLGQNTNYLVALWHFSDVQCFSLAHSTPLRPSLTSICSLLVPEQSCFCFYLTCLSLLSLLQLMKVFLPLSNFMNHTHTNMKAYMYFENQIVPWNLHTIMPHMYTSLPIRLLHKIILLISTLAQNNSLTQKELHTQ